MLMLCMPPWLQVPVAVTLLNAFQPPIIIKLAKFEQWDDPGRQVKYTVWRLFIAKLLNVLLQVRRLHYTSAGMGGSDGGVLPAGGVVFDAG